MRPQSTLRWESGDLSICPDLGEVRNSRGEAARLGPVNMKVLASLLRQPGRVVTRTELFDTVWRNQAVSDDTLTRCISDIRAELGRLSQHAGHIETLPKRGYRWVTEVRETRAETATPTAGPAGPGSAGTPVRPAGTSRTPAERAAQPASSTPAPGSPPTAEAAHAAARTAAGRAGDGRFRRAAVWLGRGLGYLGVLVLIATAAVWLIDRLDRPTRPIVVVLPPDARTSPPELVADVERRLSEYMLGLDEVDLLSRSAVDSRPSNPFPYFYYEFGARWLIETEVRVVDGKDAVTIALVDARTGIVLLQTAAPAAGSDAASLEHALRQLARFIQLELGP